MKTIKSPIYYAGNKFRLIDQIKQHMQDKIDTFYDLFGGSGTIFLNFIQYSKNAVYNEFDKNIYNLFCYLKDADFDELNEFIINCENKFNLHTKEEYYNFTKWINDNNFNGDSKYIYCVMNYSFSNGINFNKNGYINAGYGKRKYKKNIVKQNIFDMQCAMKNNNYKLYNKDALDILEHTQFENNDFVYLDPPYYNTNANYNKIWNWDKEVKLLKSIDKLPCNWALSNIANPHLIEWANINNYEIYYLDITYSSNGEGKKEHQEVLITNYLKNKQLNLFDIIGE